MSSVDLVVELERSRPPARIFWLQGVVAAVVWFVAALLIVYLPNATRLWPMT